MDAALHTWNVASGKYGASGVLRYQLFFLLSGFAAIRTGVKTPSLAGFEKYDTGVPVCHHPTRGSCAFVFRE